MVSKAYDFINGATLDDHSKQKHKILKEYFFEYLRIKCQSIHMPKFRLAVIDGFSGGGRYKCGADGSPIIFLEVLKQAINQLNIERNIQNIQSLKIECLLILNDANKDVIETLKTNVEPLRAEIKETAQQLNIEVKYFNGNFEDIFPEIVDLLDKGKWRNTLWNLDQYGHSSVKNSTLQKIMNSNPSVEIFYTFAIQSLISFLPKNNLTLLNTRLSKYDLRNEEIEILNQGNMSNNAWLRAAIRLVFSSFYKCSSFSSPFAIHNPKGWYYWLMHFSNSYRGRQAYNDILHKNSNSQAYSGSAGIDMLLYNSKYENQSYLFSNDDRKKSKEQLIDDIPRLLSDNGGAMTVEEFNKGYYNFTPAHSDDINSAMISTELEVITPNGGKRRSANQIELNDILKLTNKPTFFPILLKKD
jgi:three-Cys-motif partner protein